MFLRNTLITLFILSFAQCKQPPAIVPAPYQPTSEYDAYRHSLIELGLGDSQLLQSWMKASEDCLSVPTFIHLPYQESMFFDDLRPAAYTYRMRSKRGQKIEAQLKTISDNSARVFMDLYHVTTDTLEPYVLIASADSTQTLGYEPQVEGEYILRVQPELLNGGRYHLTVKEVALFTFPMSGRTESAILSIFGAERDAGKRIHEGNDIFASRHVPILAATSGTISYAGERGLGGRQIYITDSLRNLEVYFAHLEDVFVEEGDQVTQGDTIGTNGNSGNAQSTNPHLHFGIYADTGAIDPYHYIVPNRREDRPILADADWTGKLVRTKNKAYFDKINYRYRNKRDSVSIHTIMYAEAAWSRSYRVRLPDGRTGYVRSGDLTLADIPYKSRTAKAPHIITRSLTDTVEVGQIEVDEKYETLGRFEGQEYIRQGEAQGWKVMD